MHDDYYIQTLIGWRCVNELRISERQRKYAREGVMKDEKYERLKSLGLDFGGPKQEKKPWMEQYQSLLGNTL